MESPIALRRLAEDGVPRAVDPLVRVFAQDPFVDWLVRSDSRHDDGMRRFTTVCLRQLTMPFGAVATARFLWQALRAFGPTNVPSRLSGFDEIERHAPKTPYYYLFFVGIDPARQGMGTGSPMLRHMLDRCAAEKMPACGEATRAALVPFYQGHGYRAREPIAVPHGGPTMLPMWRVPPA